MSLTRDQCWANIFNQVQCEVRVLHALLPNFVDYELLMTAAVTLLKLAAESMMFISLVLLYVDFHDKGGGKRQRTPNPTLDPFEKVDFQEFMTNSEVPNK